MKQSVVIPTAFNHSYVKAHFPSESHLIHSDKYSPETTVRLYEIQSLWYLLGRRQVSASHVRERQSHQLYRLL